MGTRPRMTLRVVDRYRGLMRTRPVIVLVASFLAAYLSTRAVDAADGPRWVVAFAAAVAAWAVVLVAYHDVVWHHPEHRRTGEPMLPGNTRRLAGLR